MTLFRASIVPHHKRASLGFPHWLLPLLVAIGCIAVYVHFMPGLSTVPLGDARYWRQGFHSPEKTPDGQLFRWTKGKAELALPADKYVVAKAQATLRLQSGRVESGGLPVHFVHQEGIAVAQADNGFRSYHLFVRDLELVSHPDLLGGTMSTNHFSSCGRRATWVSSAAIASFVSLTPVL